MINEYVIDWPHLKKCANESRVGLRLVCFILGCLLLAVSLFFAVSSIVDGMYTAAYSFILIALLDIYIAFFLNNLIVKLQYKRLAQIYGKNSWVRTISFEDDKIIVREEKSEIKYDYSDILSIVEKDERIYLKLQAKFVIGLYKSKFVDCTWEDCKTKIVQNNPNIK